MEVIDEEEKPDELTEAAEISEIADNGTAELEAEVARLCEENRTLIEQKQQLSDELESLKQQRAQLPQFSAPTTQDSGAYSGIREIFRRKTR